MFSRNTSSRQQEQSVREAELYEQIGRLKMELEWLKKSCPVQLRGGVYCIVRAAPNAWAIY